MSARRISWAAPITALAIAFAVVIAACGSETTSRPPPTASGQSVSALKRVLVGDLSIRIPAEWQAVDVASDELALSDIEGMFIADPRHKPSNAVTFSDLYAPVDAMVESLGSDAGPSITSAELGKLIAEDLKSDGRFRGVRGKLMVLPSGLRAYEVRFDVELEGTNFTGVKYALVTKPSSASRGHLVTYEAIDSQAAHMAQFEASARSIRLKVSQLFVVAANGTAVRRIRASEANDTEPAMSPDGRRIAFASRKGGKYDVYVMNADGSGLMRLTSDPADDLDPAWSPDSRRIAFSSDRTGNTEIYVMNANGSGITRLTTSSGRDENPTWSPDAGWIAFWSDREDDREIYVMNSDGTGQKRVSVVEGSGAYGPSWTPNGRILFASDRLALR